MKAKLTKALQSRRARARKAKDLAQILNEHFCIALNLSPQSVTDAMNAQPCFLGSEKYFENLQRAILAIK